MEITLEEIQKKFGELPEGEKWAIMGANVDENLVEIGHQMGLNIEQMGQLSLETHMVILGFTQPENFASSLKGSLNLPDEKIKPIVETVNEKILKAIKMAMVTPPGVQKEEPVVIKTPPPIAPSPVTKISKEEEGILSKAGIKIIDTNLSTPELEAGKKNVEPTRPILSQKLSDPFKILSTNTEYSINNMSKEKPVAEVTTPPKKYPPNADPYRLPPE